MIQDDQDANTMRVETVLKKKKRNSTTHRIPHSRYTMVIYTKKNANKKIKTHRLRHSLWMLPTTVEIER